MVPPYANRFRTWYVGQFVGAGGNPACGGPNGGAGAAIGWRARRGGLGREELLQTGQLSSDSAHFFPRLRKIHQIRQRPSMNEAMPLTPRRLPKTPAPLATWLRWSFRTM